MAIKRVLLRRDTAVNWTTHNPILFQGELGLEFDTKKIKIGDGIKDWNTLEYLSLSVNVNDPDLTEKIEDLIGTKVAAGANTSVVYDDTTGITTINAIGDVVKADNLFGLTDYTTARTNLGLGNIDNTTDLNKPISTATQTALNTKVDKNTAITGATKTKLTYDSKGLITSGTDLIETDIPNLAISKITNLQTSLDAKQANLVSGTNIKTVNGNSVLGNGNLVIEINAFAIGDIKMTTVNPGSNYVLCDGSSTIIDKRTSVLQYDNGGDTFLLTGGGQSSLNFGSGQVYKVFTDGINLFSTGGDGGMILKKSTDMGRTWVAGTGTMGSFKTYSGLWNGSKFITCGNNSNIWHSTSLNTNFTQVTGLSTTNQTFKGIASDGGQKIAIAGDKTTSHLVYSLDNGGTWTEKTITNYTLSDIVYGNGVWVTKTTNGNVYKSTDLVNWTMTSSNGGGGALIFNNGKFVIFRGTAGIYSTDGTTWNTSVSTGCTNYENGYLTIIDNNRIVYHTSSVTKYNLTEDNGTTWVEYTNKKMAADGTYSSLFSGVTLGGLTFVGALTSVAITPNPKIWNGNIHFYYAGNFAGASNGIDGYIGGLINSYSGGKAYISKDRLTWTENNLSTVSYSENRGFVFFNGRYYVVKDNGYIYKSNDNQGYVFNSTSVGNTGGKDIYSGQYGRATRVLNNRIVIGTIYSTTADLIVSLDGVNWTKYVTPCTNSISSVDYANLKYFISPINNSGNPYYTSDFINFTQMSGLPNGYAINHIYYFGGYYYINLNGLNAIYKSNDLATWTTITPPETISVIYKDGLNFYCGTNSSKIYITQDFVSYTNLFTSPLGRGGILNLFGFGDKIVGRTSYEFIISKPSSISNPYLYGLNTLPNIPYGYLKIT